MDNDNKYDKLHSLKTCYGTITVVITYEYGTTSAWIVLLMASSMARAAA